MSDGSTAPRPTMKDVAKLAGVSLKTVSRVVNDEPNVSPELVDRVNVAAKQLDYRPNFTASNLRRSERSTRTVGLLLENVANPFSAALLRAIEDVARSHGVAVVSASVDEDPDRERQLAQTFLSRQVDGLIIAPAPGNHAYLARELEMGTPIVFVDRPPTGLDADTVSSENREGAYQAVLHLLANGHRDIAFLSDLISIPTAADRLSGYRRALAEAGLTPDPAHVVFDLPSSEAAEAAVRRLMLSHDPPTALFTAQNLITIGAVRALRALDLHKRVALIGFDEFLLSDLLDPPVSVVEQNIYAMGQRAAAMLFERLQGTRTGTGQHVRVPVSLLNRASGDIPPPPA